MSNNVTFQDADLATPPKLTVVETLDQGGGVQRQVIHIGSPTGTPTAPSANYFSTVEADGQGIGPFAMTSTGVAFTTTMAPYESMVLGVTCASQFLNGGLVLVEASVDGTNYFTIAATDQISGFGSVTAIFATGLYTVSGSYASVRVSVQVYVSGTINISAILRKSPIPPTTVAITGPVKTYLSGTTNDPNAGIIPVVNQTIASSGVLKASAGNAYKINVHNTNAAIRYAFLMNLTAAPANGTISASVMDVKTVAAGADVGWDFTGCPPMGFTVGICVLLSSTQFPTLTLAADGIFSGMVA